MDTQFVLLVAGFALLVWITISLLIFYYLQSRLLQIRKEASEVLKQISQEIVKTPDDVFYTRFFDRVGWKPSNMQAMLDLVHSETHHLYTIDQIDTPSVYFDADCRLADSRHSAFRPNTPYNAALSIEHQYGRPLSYMDMQRVLAQLDALMHINQLLVQTVRYKNRDIKSLEQSLAIFKALQQSLFFVALAIFVVRLW